MGVYTCLCGSIRCGHVHRPGPQWPRPATTSFLIRLRRQIRSLDDREILRQLPVSYRVCRIYAEDHAHDLELAAAMD